MSVEEPYSFELLGMAAHLDKVDPGLGQRAFDRGMGFLLRRGYEPEANLAILSMILLYGPAADGKEVDAVANYDRLARFGYRLLDLGPVRS